VNLKDEDRTFVPVDPPGFTSSPAGQPVSTITGDTKSVGVTGQGGTQFNYPGGFDQSTFTLAAPELTVGSFMGTRAVVRWFSAEIGKSDYGKLELFGIGGQHSVSQYFPGLPVDVAAGVFYQTFKIGDGLLDTKALHLDVTGSKSFGLIQPYVAIGYDTFKMDVDYNSTSNPGPLHRRGPGLAGDRQAPRRIQRGREHRRGDRPELRPLGDPTCAQEKC